VAAIAVDPFLISTSSLHAKQLNIPRMPAKNELPTSDCQLPIAEWQKRAHGTAGFQSALGNRKLKIPAPHSNSAMMKNSCDEVSYSTRSTLALQQT
jgi:hypothetical protein